MCSVCSRLRRISCFQSPGPEYRLIGAEVAELGPLVAGQEDVSWLHVAMDKALPVASRQADKCLPHPRDDEIGAHADATQILEASFR